MLALSAAVPPRRVLVTGATGYLGRALVPELLRRGHRVRALVRAESAPRLPAGVEAVVGSALAVDDLRAAVAGCDTLVQLVGVPKPSPAKAAQFRAIDLVSARAAIEAAATVGGEAPHFVYVSVAQPAPVMRAYVAVRAEVEAAIRARGLRATVLRPWYVLGPGHRWPVLLLPVYWLAAAWPTTRATARRLGFVTLRTMTTALVRAVEQPPAGGVVVREAPEFAETARAPRRNDADA